MSPPIRPRAAIRPRTTIRPRTESDLDGLVGALAEVAETDGYPTRWPADPAGWLRATDVLGAWVAIDDDEALLGQITLRRPGDQEPVRLWRARGEPDDCVLISRLFVVPAARRAGLGRALLDTACARAAELGRRPVLDVVAVNRAAIAMYRRLGWIEIGQYVERFYDDAPDELLHCFAAPKIPSIMD